MTGTSLTPSPAAAATAARDPTPGEAAPAAEEREIAARPGRRAILTDADRRDDLHAFLDIPFQQLCGLSVADAKSNARRGQFPVHIEPDAPCRLHRRERPEKGVYRRGRTGRSPLRGLRTSPRGLWRLRKGPGVKPP